RLQILLIGSPRIPGTCTLWRRVAALSLGSSVARKCSKATCFIVSPIGGGNTEVRERAEFWSSSSGPQLRGLAISQFELTKSRSRDNHTSIVELLLQAPLVLADLTGGNANVFYEVAIRHAANLPIIHMIDAGERPPFDVSQFRAITLRHNDLKIADVARK